MVSPVAVREPIDVVCVGRVSVDLYGEQIGADLASAATFRRFVGGSAGNIAIGSARLGLRTAMLARAGSDAMGDYVVDELRRESIDTDSIVRDPERGTGVIALAMHEARDFPRSFLVQDPAEFALRADDIDAALIGRARAVVVTGSLLAKPTLREAAEIVLDAAAEHDTAVVFDVDYRPAFWGVVPHSQGENLVDVTPEVTEQLQSVLSRCDVVVGTEAEIRALGGSPHTADALRAIRERTDALIVLKLGPAGCRAFTADIPDDLSDAPHSPGFAVDVVNSVGAGDAFMAGFLRGYLRDTELATALQWANACGALVVGRLGCSGDCPSMDELEQFLNAVGTVTRSRAAPSDHHARFVTATRHRNRDELCVFAIDHRGHLERIAASAGRPYDDVTKFKNLALTAFLRAHWANSSVGVLIDDMYVPAPLRERIADSGLWSARALEISGRAPLQLSHQTDVGAFVNEWPKETVVKVLVTSAADDDPSVRHVTEQRLRSLSEICHRRYRDLLVEVLPSPGTQNSADDLVQLMRHWYRIGIQPAWWKLPDLDSEWAWAAVAEAVRNHDPACRGIVMLGGGTSDEGLAKRLRKARSSDLVKGFAIGRPIFHDAAEQWFQGHIDDAEAADLILARYRDVAATWADAKP